MTFRSERLRGFTFTSPIPKKLPVQNFLVGTGKDSNGKPVFLARCTVNGEAIVANPCQRVNGILSSGVVFNPKKRVMDM